MRLLAIDYGKKKIGLAIGDSDVRVAVPLEVVPGGSDAAARIGKLVKEDGIEALVVGVPLAEEHHSGTQQRVVEAFIEELRKHVVVPIHTVDERFTTSESQRIQEETGTGVPEDALAAMIILESYFNENG